MKKYLPYILVFLASFALTPFAFQAVIKKANERAADYIEHFDPVTSELPNGKYLGKFKAFKLFTLSKIEFEIEDGIVTNIEIIRLFHSPGNPYKDEIEYQIKKSKKLEVNAISGATRSSNFAKAAIKKAIEKRNVNKQLK